MFRKNREKIFCIGLNKTGTTSIGSFLEKSNLKVARQKDGELLLSKYINRDFNSIIKYVNNSKDNVFQDVPFSLPYTYNYLDVAFPNSKFILTVRNSNLDWYNSILTFHSNFYNNGEIPTKQSLLNSEYIYKGWSWDLMSDVYFHNDMHLYEKNEFLDFYDNYVRGIKNYFKNKPNKFIVINLSKQEDFLKLCNFLNITTTQDKFPKITSADIVNSDYNCKFLT